MVVLHLDLYLVLTVFKIVAIWWYTVVLLRFLPPFHY